jgi:hypothetical protein
MTTTPPTTPPAIGPAKEDDEDGLALVVVDVEVGETVTKTVPTVVVDGVAVMADSGTRKLVGQLRPQRRVYLYFPVVANPGPCSSHSYSSTKSRSRGHTTVRICPGAS